MGIFKFNVNQKVKLWESVPVEIEADNQELAMKKLKEMLKENKDISKFVSGKSRLLEATKENIRPDDKSEEKVAFCKPMKQEFEFYVDEKVTVWARTSFSVTATSYEEAEEWLLNNVKKDESNVFSMDNASTTYLYETEEHLVPSENGGCATLEIYNASSHEPIYLNGK